MKLWSACAYATTPVLSGLWKTCGLVPGVPPSLQINAVHSGIFGVEKNLFGVSREVTVPGVLAFGHIFAALRGGNAVCPEGR